MIFKDQCRYAFGNLRKTLLRTILTAAGVSIGIGAMTSMVSVGLGTQRLVLRAFNEGNILSSIMVSPGESADTIPDDSLPALDSATTELFRTLPGVRDAFPRITIAGLLRYKDDEIDQVRRGFMFMNSLLGTIGGVSLFVAAMMIVNTLVMAVLERTPEIGLLKSMGATDGDVMRLFLTEASIIGVVGGSGGLILGYVVARITNVVANIQFQRAGEVSVNLVALTPFLILGGLAFAVIVSLLAGYYPARRAAKVDPVVALRHF
jgi:ABC-type lipoprotein release transport system permease subunit